MLSSKQIRKVWEFMKQMDEHSPAMTDAAKTQTEEEVFTSLEDIPDLIDGLRTELASRDQRIAELEAELQAIYEAENPIDSSVPPFVKGQLVRLHPMRNRDDAKKCGLELGRTYEVYEVEKHDFYGSGWSIEVDAMCGVVDSSWFIKVI